MAQHSGFCGGSHHPIEGERARNCDPVLEAPARTQDEPRFLAVGTVEGKHWSAVSTRRGDKIRLISVRRSRQEEIEHYES